jgi:acetyltransferase-like isoleucine patch superfamily enzyme
MKPTEERILVRGVNCCVVPSALAAPVLRLLGVDMGTNARIHTPLHLHNTQYHHLIMGKNCHIGRDVFFDLSRKIGIGDNVTLSMRSTFITHFDVGDSPLQHYGYPSDEGDIHIRDGVYIGAGATILHGVEIGENSLIAAGTLVKESIPPYSLVAGIPGRIIRRIEERSISNREVDDLQNPMENQVITPGTVE